MEWNIKTKRSLLHKICVSLVLLMVASPTHATTYSSTNYTIENPIVGGGGVVGSSTNYQLQGVVGQTGEGSSDSAGSELRAGALYYSIFTTAPVITSATAGTGQVTLVWSAASGNVAVDDYELGVATTSGAQVYTSVGNVLTTVVSSLTGGTTYYFKIRAVDVSGTVRTTSAEVSAIPTAATSGGGGGGGGGGGVVIPPPLTPDPSSPTPGPGETDESEVPPVEEEPEVGAPTAPTARLGEPVRATVMRWNFTDNSDNETGFVLTNNGQIIGRTGSNGAYIDENVLANTLLVGRAVYAENSIGLSSSSNFSDTRSAIETPRTLYGQQFGVPNALQLRVESESVVFTNLYEGQSAIEFINTTKGTSSGWVKTDNIVVSGLDAGVPYTFQARARNAVGRVTAYSAPFTFTLPGDPPVERDDTDELSGVDGEPVYSVPLVIVSPAFDAVVSKTVVVELQSESYAVLTLQVNTTVSTALADANGRARFSLEDLPSGTYQVSAVAVGQAGGRSRLARTQFTVESVAGQAEPSVGFVIPLAPDGTPPPEIVQPPLTRAEIVSSLGDVEQEFSILQCGWECWFIIVFAVVYTAIVASVWYLVWHYYSKPITSKNKRSRKK